MNNKGSSLIVVLITLTVVGVIAAIVMEITITNIQMKEVEQSSASNFYSAEEITDEISVGLNDKAAEALQNAYEYTLINYKDLVSDGSDMQTVFTRQYIENLKNIFWNKNDATYKVTKTKTENLNVEVVIYCIGYYDPQVLSGCISTPGFQGALATTEGQATFAADYVDGTMTLQNVEIKLTDAKGYESTIKTDMVFHTPTMNFDGTNYKENFMKYALIADQGILMNAEKVEVNGSVYAGVGGIKTMAPATAKFVGENIITRGDIQVTNGTTLTMGDGTSKIWAENITTEGKGDASTLNLDGFSYVADDLTLNGRNSTVNISGNYYGYNFRKDYVTTTLDDHDASYSSAMIVNAKNAKLNLSGLNSLYLAGRTFISRGSAGNTQNADIPLGESVAVRTNQLAYNVDEKYLLTKDAENNRLAKASFADGQLAAYEKAIGVSNVMSYLVSDEPVVAYFYRDNGNVLVRYYLNFSSDANANAFYSAYFDKNKSKVNDYAKAYSGADAIIIGDGLLYQLNGNMMYKTASMSSYNEKDVSITNSDWEKDGTYWDYSNRLAINYRCLETYLEDTHTGINASNVRIMDPSGRVDKTQDSLFELMIDETNLVNDITENSDVERVTDLSGDKKQLIAVVNNPSSTYVIANTMKQGIVLAIGNVHVEGDFTGLIIAGGEITFSAGAKVTADELLVSNLFNQDLALNTPVFTQYFKSYNTLSSKVIGLIQLDDYMTYENWKKNE